MNYADLCAFTTFVRGLWPFYLCLHVFYRVFSHISLCLHVFWVTFMYILADSGRSVLPTRRIPPSLPRRQTLASLWTLLSAHSGHCERDRLIRPEYCGVWDSYGQFVPVLAPSNGRPLLNSRSQRPFLYCPCEGFGHPLKVANCGVLCTKYARFAPKWPLFAPF